MTCFFHMAKTLVSAVLYHCMTEEAEKCPVSVSAEEEDGATAKSCGGALLLCPSCVLLPAPLCPSNRQSLCCRIGTQTQRGSTVLGQLK